MDLFRRASSSLKHKTQKSEAAKQSNHLAPVHNIAPAPAGDLDQSQPSSFDEPTVHRNEQPSDTTLPELNRKRISWYFGRTSAIHDSGFADDSTEEQRAPGQHAVPAYQADHPSVYSSTLTPIDEGPTQQSTAAGVIAHSATTNEPNRTMTPSRLKLELPSDPRLVDQKLRLFEALALKGQLTDDDMVVTLSQAIDSSEFKDRMAEVLETAHLSSYNSLKKILVDTVKLDLDERYQLIFTPIKSNPLLAYNQLKEINPTAKDSDLVPMLKAHLPSYFYSQLLHTSFSDKPLKQVLAEFARTQRRGVNLFDEGRDFYENVELRQLKESNAALVRQVEELKNTVNRPLVNHIGQNQTPAPTQQVAQSNASVAHQEHAAEQSALTTLANAMTALVNNVGVRPANRGRFDRRDRNGGSGSGDCFYHGRFGHEANCCRPPCPKFNPQVFCIPANDGVYKKAPQQPQHYAPPPNYAQATAANQNAQTPVDNNQAPNASNGFNFQQLLEFANVMRQFAGGSNGQNSSHPNA